MQDLLLRSTLSARARLAAIVRDCEGVTALEYGLIAAAVVAIGLAGFNLIGDDLATKVTSVTEALS